MSNKSNGTQFEEELSKMLFKDGFWTHMMNANRNGQPADIITVKNGKCFLIDAKDCTKDEFLFKRIEFNQRNAMHLWKKTNNGVGWFAFRTSRGILFIDLDTLEVLEKKGLKKIKFNEEVENLITYKEWIKKGDLTL